MKALIPLIFSLLLLAATFHHLPQSSAAVPGDSDFIRSACNTTLYADLCHSSISPYANAIKQNPSALARVGVAVAHAVVRGVATDVSALSREAKGRAAGAINDCISILGDAVDQMSESLGQLRQIAAGKGGDFKFAIDTVLTEMSAALTNEDTCTDEFQDEPEGPVKNKVVDGVAKANKFTSIALAFVNYYAKKGSP
ncbi:pectinesterase inhibitor 7-like [Prosopis cineraria]|uniref:pectinesterase inhibitor 7-like n=1 Tax=Prosopis cineraria TaxID=364024 RepID=UPI00240EA211|nr:pectinesterase inhibitor 7-like [Prosopis cineraria]